MVVTCAEHVAHDLADTATYYEQVAALEPGYPRDGWSARSTRVPPGASEILDADEIARALGATDEWAEFVHHVAVDECGAQAAATTPERLRETAAHAAHFVEHHDELFALSFLDDLHDQRVALRRIAERSEVRLRTGEACRAPGCRGYLVAATQRTTDLECALCRCRVPYEVWSTWPRARVRYVTAEHAARLLGTTVHAVRMRASRGRWRRVGTGSDVRYHVDDVRGAA